MKYFTKFLCLFLGAAMMLTMAACGSKSDTDTNAGADGEKKQLVVATSPDFPPFESLDGSQIVGIEPALMQAIADKLGMELVWEQVDFDSIIPGIQAERYDVGAAGITVTPDRQNNCDFSDPYFLANQVIVVNPGSGRPGGQDHRRPDLHHRRGILHGQRLVRPVLRLQQRRPGCPDQRQGRCLGGG